MNRKNCKVVPIIFRTVAAQTEILVFRHPLAGIQIVKGTVEIHETLEDAALRELKEESGIISASIDQYLGLHNPTGMGANWHVFLCETADKLPEKWQHWCNDDGGLVFSFFWHPLNDHPNDDWHQIFKDLFKFIQKQMIS